jgi:hypothetical protein
LVGDEMMAWHGMAWAKAGEAVTVLFYHRALRHIEPISSCTQGG